MSYVAPESDLRQPTVSWAAVSAKLAGTPLQGYEAVFWSLAQQYGVDPNWALSYLQWESAFGSRGVSTGNPTNPWDIASYPGQWGQVGSYDAGNGFNAANGGYAVYPDVSTGLEAGFRLWRSYADAGYSSWWASLSRALCGNPDGCGGTWVNNVIATGGQNAAQWPYDGSTAPPPSSGAPPSSGTPPRFSFPGLSMLTEPRTLALLALGLILVGAGVRRG